MNKEMNRLATNIQQKISRKYLIFSFVVMVIIGFFMIGVFSAYFSSQANGYPYMETKFFYTPSDLFEMAQGYGAAGRALYTKCALSLDLLVPLFASNFLTAFALFLLKKCNNKNQHSGQILTLGIAICASDWLENICMVSILKIYPQKIMPIAVLGRTMTTIKYVLMLLLFVVIVWELIVLKRQK